MLCGISEIIQMEGRMVGITLAWLPPGENIQSVR